MRVTNLLKIMAVETALKTDTETKLHHILEAQQFTPEWLTEELFPLAKSMEGANKTTRSQLLTGITGFNLFYEASTRTRTSFAQAVTLLGGKCEGTENARAFSSVTKGETLEDTVRILNGYEYDYIVLRHDEEGGAKRAAEVSEAPIINAGDGTGQHPTQALLDVYTISEQFGRLRDLKVAMVGDLDRGRTVHSLTYLLSKFPEISFDFTSPPNLRIKPDMRDYLLRHGVPFSEDNDLDDILPRADVIYMTRLQKERDNGEADHSAFGEYAMTRDRLNLMKESARVMHPLPRNSELPPELDDDPRIIPFRQAQNGLYIRMALLYMLFKDKNP